MFAIVLQFSTNKSAAREHMDGHNAWLRKGFDDGVFLVSGSLVPGRGGIVLAAGEDAQTLRRRVDEDPFVEHGVVEADLLEFNPSKADPRLEFLLS